MCWSVMLSWGTFLRNLPNISATMLTSVHRIEKVSQKKTLLSKVICVHILSRHAKNSLITGRWLHSDFHSKSSQSHTSSLLLLSPLCSWSSFSKQTQHTVIALKETAFFNYKCTWRHHLILSIVYGSSKKKSRDASREVYWSLPHNASRIFS